MSELSQAVVNTYQTEYIDLLINIGEKIIGNTFHLEITSSSGEKAEGLLQLQVSEREIGSILKALSLGSRLAKPSTGSGVFRLVRGITKEQQELVIFGKKLFSSLMQDQKIRSSYEHTLNAMWADRNKGIRLRLEVQDPDLQGIPWELLHDGERFLAVSALTPLVRYLRIGVSSDPLKTKPPLRLLVVSACPKGQIPLSVEKEWQAIEQAIQNSNGIIQPDFESHVSLRSLSRKLLQACRAGKPYHILHFVGHGHFRDTTSELVFEREERKSDYIDGRELVNVLLSHRYLRLVVLNACEGARGDLRDPFNSVAVSLLKAGIPAVVAMQFPISDQAATRFSSEFYHSLALGSPIEYALGDARTQIYAIEGNVEFATPVLYMQTPDGQLFDTTNLPETTLKSIQDKVEQKRQEKDKGALDGKTTRKPNWEMIGGLTGVAGVFISILAIVLPYVTAAKPTPTPSLAATRTPTQIATISPSAAPSSPTMLIPTFTTTPSSAPAQTNTPVLSTNTSVPPTNTPQPPTDTPAPPTNTLQPPTHTPLPATDTPAPPTDTPFPPTDTPQSPTPTPTNTPKPRPVSKGKIAFVSDRDGDNEIFVVNDDSSDLQKLTTNNTEDSNPGWSPDGKQIVFAHQIDSRHYTDIWIMDADGSNAHAIEVNKSSVQDAWPSWSPTGEWIVFQSNRDPDDHSVVEPGGSVSIWRIRPDGSDLCQVAYHQGKKNELPTWSPDGRRIVFQSDRTGKWQLWSVDLHGGDEIRLTNDQHNNNKPVWSPAGNRIVFYTSRDGGNNEIYTVSAYDRDTSDPDHQRLTDATSTELDPVWSPDGSKLAFTSNRNGRWQIWILSLDVFQQYGPFAAVEHWQLLTDGDSNQPAWWGP